MSAYKFFAGSITILIFSLVLMSCAGSSSVSQNNSANIASSSYPEWYNQNRSVIKNDDTYLAYASLVASDSSSALETAKSRAKSKLGSNLVNKLESIRNEALIEFGSDSGLDQSSFIIALSKSDRTISSVAESSRSKVQKAPNDEAYYGFAEATVNREKLINRLDKKFSAFGKAWNAMKSSDNFADF